jgi:tRNA pseudouridine38-40 synthase
VFIKEGHWTPFLARYAYRLDYPVKTAAMNEAAHALLGTHDFKEFGNIDPSRPHRDTTCTLSAADVVETDKAAIFMVSGDHFLYHMVRRMAYFVLKAGQGRIGAETWNSAFVGPDVPFTRQVMAAGGLYLVAVDYA